MEATDVIRLRVDPKTKSEFTEKCAERGTTVSQALRELINRELADGASPAERFQAIMESARLKVESSGIEEPTIDEINEYIAAVRQERRSDLKKAS
ncbi:MAG: type II toxin-antitoxin system RelB/DinJ family antitoxin [Coriobacteriales bacterium]|jgi:antitoxin component of RelBE/YafQ-DinJ toxin-antitoxin module|nr:type II toxin-antitoxin system RelB/DinJ family antitoxin [Coriobacteriales bacterium]